MGVRHWREANVGLWSGAAQESCPFEMEAKTLPPKHRLLDAFSEPRASRQHPGAP